MNIYLIFQIAVSGYDTYSKAVVIAENMEEALRIHPDGSDRPLSDESNYTWAKSPHQVNAVYLGAAASYLNGPKVVCATFHTA